MSALTAVQARALRLLAEHGEGDGYYQSRRDVSLNWYHPRHQPGNLYIDNRTARVLIDRGLAEVRYGVLGRTEAGTTLARQTGAGRRQERTLP